MFGPNWGYVYKFVRVTCLYTFAGVFLLCLVKLLNVVFNSVTFVQVIELVRGLPNLYLIQHS